MKKVVTWSLFLYVGFALFIYWYLFGWNHEMIPDMYKGTSADPQTFMSARELTLSQDYSRVKNLLFFLATPLEWIILLFVLVLGVSKRFEKWSKETVKVRVIQVAIYLFYLSLLTTVLALPLQWIGHQVSVNYGISTQSTASWIKDHVIDFWVNYIMMFLIVSVLLWLIHKFPKRWWLAGWALSVPFTIFLTFVQPVVIDPLYNDFSTLQNKELEDKILALADRADIPANHVYEVNMSEKTNALNAYVTGIGLNSRIVLWNTTLQQLKDKEILFIMAHEMGHYVMKHIYLGVASYIVLTFIGMYFISRIINMCIRKWGSTLQISKVACFSVIPLFFLISSVLSFAVSPASNYVSRIEERAADQYALDMTKDGKSGVKTFQYLSKTSLSQVNPPALVKFFLYTHPPIFERIHTFEQYEKEKK
ncbi:MULTISPECIES: M48 family metallopeptidase [Bacillus cereus group]|uniref:M48 family metallopeptidase n=1 Tax=Bacillus cereus group TaxID=86661 RepID=UPI000BF60904|nr:MULTISPECIES: M48 family metallopeptidase [Bacillus cereus group]PFA24715.1 peptidase M48 [Bacillus cereus]PFO80045.1 peptidase M48 [Bacillus cereus]PFR24969.1 peptidase M48 [Bacillus cereus]PGZ18717.1 peptidase M48 [Bacillus cereus]